MTCPDCERYKKSAANWRNKAYELAGTPLPWDREEHVTTLRQAAEQALEALKAYGSHASNCDHLMLLTSLPPQRKPCSCGLVASITTLQEALAQEKNT